MYVYTSIVFLFSSVLGPGQKRQHFPLFAALTTPISSPLNSLKSPLNNLLNSHEQALSSNNDNQGQEFLKGFRKAFKGLKAGLRLLNGLFVQSVVIVVFLCHRLL